MSSASAMPIVSPTRINIPDLQDKLRRRVAMVAETAKKLAAAG
jgi:hypothetical protein